MEGALRRSRTRGAGVPFGDKQDPTCEGQLLEAMDSAQAEVTRPRMGEFPGDATHASLMQELKVGPKTVADQLGHSVDVDLNVYTNTALGLRKEALDTFESALRIM